MRKLVTRGLAGGLLAGAIALGGMAVAGTAQAAPAGPQHVVPPGYEFYDDYWTYAGCREAGLSGKAQGNWREWHCEESAVDWNLWVLY
ncbi:hypothetical protein Afil01_17760 [Actinorhabdospora filicis]|uniref:Secreted protein n=1 Tax=Actinorhabdospora filicis TaxID=1785913 RepID=A0A9W6W7W2_9ACTN|nr:hypothetical protein [Actinorhabdospora filicis]GLZ76969.1 hypothetical protein Afil01_17760 [Actinorhabdospora filicis]